MRVSGAIKSVLHGVTTNNLVTASSEHWREQTNVIPRTDEGLSKRPPAEIIGNIGTPLDAGEFVKKFIIHDVAYFLTVRKDPLTLTVTREDGVNYTVTDEAADSYLTDIDEDDLKLTVHGELIFLVNKSRTTQMEANTDTYATNSLLYFKGEITAGAVINVTAVNTSNNKVTKSHTVAASPATMPGNLASTFASAFNAEADMTATARSGVCQIVLSDGTSAQITVESDLDEDNIIVLNDTVADFTDLPKTAYIGKRIAVQAPDSPEGTEVYMKAVYESYKDEELAITPPSTVWGTAHGSIEYEWREYTPNFASSVGWLGSGVQPTTKGTNWYRLEALASRHNGGTPWQDGDGNQFYRSTATVIKDGTGAIDWDNDPEPDWQLQYNTAAPANLPYGTKVYWRLADPSTPAVTITMPKLEQREVDPATYGDLFLNPGYFMTPSPDYNDEWDPLPRYADTYSYWFNDEGAAPAVNTALVQVRWIEVAAPSIKVTPNNATMPHLLVPNSDGTTFSYSAPNWIDRKAGDNVSNPLPEFMNTTIEDIIIFQNRLAILSDDIVTMSATGDVFNFFRDTVTQLLSKHPISIRSTSALSSKLNFFVYHNRDLLVTTKRQQYKISGEVPVTPQTASMSLTTTYNASDSVEPESIGSNVYIPNHNGQYLNINRYDGSNQDLAPDAASNITDHCSKYIKGTVNMITGLPNHGLLFAAAVDGQDIYVCNYDTEITRSESTRYAWFKWNDFTDDANYKIKSIANVKNKLLLVIQTTQGLNLVAFDVNSLADKKHLDYLIVNTSTTTTIDVGTTYGLNEAAIKVVQGTGCPDPGDYATIDSMAAGVITLTTSMGGGTVYVGREFTVTAVPNLITLRDQDGAVNDAAKLRIQKFIIKLVDSGSCDATEQSPHDTYTTQEFSGLVNNDLETITGDAATVEEDFDVGFKQYADVGTLLITSTSWLPLTIAQVDWRGNYNQRGRRF